MDTPSKQEARIGQLLNELSIYFEREKVFPELKSQQGAHLPVDFALCIDDFLAIIEYNGAQHYQPINKTPEAVDAWKRLNTNGNSRLNFTKKYDIPYLVIHYLDHTKLPEIIKKFVNDIQQHSQQQKIKYTKNTKGYFGSYPYRKFEATEVLSQKPSTNPLELTKNSQLGFVKLGQDTILWTQSGLDKLRAQIDQSQQTIKKYEAVTAKLIMNISDLEQQLEQYQWPATAESIPDFTAKFRKSDAPKSPLTTEAKIYIHLLASSYHLTGHEIKRKLANEYQQTISLTTIEKYIH
ncbi:hypothetical protein ACFQ4L_05115 [Lapidilactobacillus mulanensis]|uniref:DUF559 domain-containing protein n=1 Tax=Lapidilactobacillus mulanensis TaxID=2485999 RepID=A0ABW4DLC9_9LACO|nr:hypothetical protein [Lapidilactobacillus mulanensis]